MDKFTMDWLSQATVEEIITGYQIEEDGYRCVICGAFFEKGRIYPLVGALYNGEREAV